MTTNVVFHVIIPARYASTRLPGKPLADIAGKPMIQHVYECAKKSGAQSVIIATDDERIMQVGKNFGADVCMTSTEHLQGTDRLAEVVTKRELADDAIIVNLQGDSLFVDPLLLYDVAALLHQNQLADMTTPCELIQDETVLTNPSVVKVVRDINNYALYFSRAIIPWNINNFSAGQTSSSYQYYRHLGIYAYRVAFLKQYVKWSVSPIEQSESLEQLRVLWHGAKILVPSTKRHAGVSVDTEADLHHARQLLMTESL